MHQNKPFRVDNPSKRLRSKGISMYCRFHSSKVYMDTNWPEGFKSSPFETEDEYNAYYNHNTKTYLGLQDSTIITNDADYNKSISKEKQSRVYIENGEVVSFMGELFETRIRGDYSDAVEFIKISL
jgi:hypothetical protein